MKNILVLGGSGFVGTHVCEKLVQQGWRVTVPTRRRAQAQHLLPMPRVTVIELDVHDEAALQRAVAGHEAVVNLVAILHGTPAAFERVHVTLVQKLARACMATGVRQVVHVSALGADAWHPLAPPSMYLRSKSQGEAVWIQATEAQQGALAVTILRPSVIFGAEDKFLNLFAKLQKVLPVVALAGAHARFQPVWVQDVAAAVVCSLKPQSQLSNPQVLELCGPDVFTLQQLVRLSAQLSGVRQGRGRPVLALPDWLGRLQARLMELAPGAPLMSRDNLDSMRFDNITTGQWPGLSALGITPAALVPIAQDYLMSNHITHGLTGVRLRRH